MNAEFANGRISGDWAFVHGLAPSGPMKDEGVHEAKAAAEAEAEGEGEAPSARPKGRKRIRASGTWHGAAFGWAPSFAVPPQR